MTLWHIRLKAFVIHLILSVVIITLFLLVVSQIWFPGPLFELENVWQGLQILIPVDAVLGPLLTLILFVPGKKGLKLDLTVIAIFQIGALVYGGLLIYKQRPVAYAFVVDRFEVVLASEDYFADIPMERFINEGDNFPLITYVKPPQSDKERSHFLINGINIKKIADRHYPIRPNMNDIIKHSLDIKTLENSNEKTKDILSKFKEKKQSSKADLIFLPLQASTYKSIIVAIDSGTGEIKQYIPIDPWNKQS